MLTLSTVENAETFVSQQKALGNDVRWDNYDIVFFRADARGYHSRGGAFRNGRWGFDNRFSVTPEGKWHIDWRNVRRARPANA